jgi:hypothetical protein
LVWESGATPYRYTYSVHLSTFTKNLVGLGHSHLALNQRQIALTRYSKSDGALDNFAKSRKIWLTRIKAQLPSTRGLLMRFGTMGTTSPRFDREEQGGLP